MDMIRHKKEQRIESSTDVVESTPALTPVVRKRGRPRKSEANTNTPKLNSVTEPTKKSTRLKRPPNRDDYIVDNVCSFDDSSGEKSVVSSSNESDDVQNCVIDTSKNTPAASDDEYEMNRKLVFSSQEARSPICEHPKKKILRSLNAGLSLDDNSDVFTNGTESTSNCTPPLPVTDYDNFKQDFGIVPFSDHHNGGIPCLSDTKSETSTTSHSNNRVHPLFEDVVKIMRTVNSLPENTDKKVKDSINVKDSVPKCINSENSNKSELVAENAKSEIGEKKISIKMESLEETSTTKQKESLIQRSIVSDNIDVEVKEHMECSPTTTTFDEPLTKQLSTVSLNSYSLSGMKQICSNASSIDDDSYASNLLNDQLEDTKMSKITTFDFLGVDNIDNSIKTKAAEIKSKTAAARLACLSKNAQDVETNAGDKNQEQEKIREGLFLGKVKKTDDKLKRMVKKVAADKKYLDKKVDKKEKEENGTDKIRRSSRIKSNPHYEKYEEVMQSLSRGENDKILYNNLDSVINHDDTDLDLCNRESKPKPDQNEPSAIISVDPEFMPSFQHIAENVFRMDRIFNKGAVKMICDCVLTKEEIIRGDKGCGDDCLNRLLFIECCNRCSLSERCSNKRFQNREYSKCEVFRTEKKGNGLRVLEDIPSGTFLMEYVGEVIDADEFETRAIDYAEKKIPHFYFMSLRSDCIIDATIHGNCSRFINHSCEPNSETQKWTVEGELRIGFFSKRAMKAGEEVTFDYQLQRYGKQAQRCYCETPSCTGWIGDDPDKIIVDDGKFKERKKKKEKDQYFDIENALDEISSAGLSNRHQTLNLNRLMVHAKELPIRMQILQLIEDAHPACRRLFVDYHGLPILWSWMVDCTPNQEELKIQLLTTLKSLPITNKTILVESKVYSQVEQWAFVVEQKIKSEMLSAQSVLNSVEEIASADETPVSELAQKVLNDWSSLREAYKIPKKERIQQMKEHEREADQNNDKPQRTNKLPLYAEKMRNAHQRNRHNSFEKVVVDRYKRRDSPDNRNHYDKDRDRGDNYYRKLDHRDNSVYNAVINRHSKEEHRHNFTLRVMKEEERKKGEEERKYWQQMQQQQQHNAMYYGAHPIISGQYVPPVPNTTYNSDGTMMDQSQIAMLQNMQQSVQSTGSIANAPAAHSYYANMKSYMGPMSTVQPGHPGTPTGYPPMCQTPNSVPPQSYYPSTVATAVTNAVVLPSPVTSTIATSTFPHQAIADLTKTMMSESLLNSVVIDNSPDQRNVSSASAASSLVDIANSSSTHTSLNGSSFMDSSLLSSITENSDQTMTSFLTSAISEYSKESNVPPPSERARYLLNISLKDPTRLQLPKHWKKLNKGNGVCYYYHRKTKVTRWYPPSDCEVFPSDEDDDERTNSEGNGLLHIRKKRKSVNSDTTDHAAKRIKEKTKLNDLDPELRENLAAMSSVFKYTEEDDSPLVGDEKSVNNDQTSDVQINRKPLVTEIIISPREPVDREERRREKKRIKSLKEQLRREKKKKLESAKAAEGALEKGCKNGDQDDECDITNTGSNSKSISVAADTSSNSERKKKEEFRANMATYVVHCLNPFFKKTCTKGRITNNEDFKHLARKLTHYVIMKEMKHCQSVNELTCNSSVKHKAKEYIRKYMSKFDEEYKRPVDDHGSY